MKKESNAMEEELISVLKAVYKADISITQGVSVIQDIIRLAEESLVRRVRKRINGAINRLPSDMTMMQSGAFLTLNTMLDWEELSAPKPKGDK